MVDIAWRKVRALGRAGFLAGLLMLGALAAGRSDLAALAAPFVAVVALAARPAEQSGLSATLRSSSTRCAEGTVLDVTVVVRTEVALDACVVRLPVAGGLAVVGGRDTQVMALRAGEERTAVFRVRCIRWGRHALGPAVVEGWAAGLGVRRDPVRSNTITVRVHPVAAGFDALDAVPFAVTPAGIHRSRLRGEGLEVSGVRVFSPGDRMRRINWRVTMRTGELSVTDSVPERGSDVVVVMDTLHEAGRPKGPDDPASSLDVTVRAAAAIALHFLDAGDRVAVLDYGGLPRYLPPSGGSGQRARILESLLDTAVCYSAYDAAGHFLSPRMLPSRSLVVALTPLLDEVFSSRLVELRRRGQPLVVVDVLPPEAMPVPRGAVQMVADQVWRLEREELVAGLEEVGVPVVAWHGAGSLDGVLRDVSRIAAAPRLVRR